MATTKKVRSAYIDRLLKTLSDKHLKNFYTIANSLEFESLKEVVGNVNYNTMVDFFKLDHNNDAHYLAQEGAWSKGVVFGLKTLVRLIEESTNEKERREVRKRK